MNRKYHIIVFGCQMNVSDAERVSAVLESAKCKRTPDINKADLIVATMCSVRQTAVDRVHGLAQKFKLLKNKNPRLKTILTGCVLKKDKKIFIKGFDYVINVKNIKKLPLLLSAECENDLILKDDYLSITPKYTSKFSASVPIMTGCNNFCAYCVVPYIRDREISRPANEIISEIKKLVKKPARHNAKALGGGYKEIWLLGQNVNSYKDEILNPKTQIPNKFKIQNLKTIKFPELLKVVNDIPGNFWIRFTSSHPKDFNDEVVNAMAKCKKVTPYLNLPVQSGDDKVLKSMNRHYTVAQYKNKIKKLREKIPDIALSTDVIVGFPGETKKQFENTAKLFREIKFDMAYINKYSPRPGTAAAKLKDSVPVAEKKRREKVLTKILKQTALERNKKLVGKITTVLIEGKKSDFWLGKNEQYKSVRVHPVKSAKGGVQTKVGQFNRVKITKAREWALDGKFLNEPR